MVAALKGFCSFLVRRGYLDADPTEDLRLKRPPEQPLGRVRVGYTAFSRPSGACAPDSALTTSQLPCRCT